MTMSGGLGRGVLIFEGVVRVGEDQNPHPVAKNATRVGASAEKIIYCRVTRTWITPSPVESGSRALPRTAPIILVLSVAFMA
jgi:hypothetical protein